MSLGSSDLRLTLRLLRSQPGLAILAVLGIAVGIGTATAAFAIARGLFLAPLPVPGGERVVLVWDQHRLRGDNVYIGAEELAFRRQYATAFEDLAGYSSRTVLMERRGGVGGPLRAAYITPNAFALLGLSGAIGRGLTDSDALPGAPPVVVVSDDVWRSRLGASADVLGTDVQIAGVSRTIVGVMPPGVRFPIREEVWIPESSTAGVTPASRMIVFGKLKPGLSPRQAEEELARIDLPRATPDNQLADLTQRVMPFTRGIGGPEQTTVLVAASVVLLLLLAVAAANVANLVLARNAGRDGEIALRTALGASRWRVVRLLLLESLALAAIGGAMGLGAAYAGLRWFDAASQALNTLPWWADVSIDPLVVAFLVVATFVAAAAIGLVPALKVTRACVSDVLRQHAGHIAGIRFGRLSATMVALEFAIAVALIGAAATIGRGLLSFSFNDYQLPGEQTLISQIYFGQPAFPEGATPEVRQRVRQAHYDTSLRQLRRIEEGLQRIPGVRTTSVASAYPGNEVDPVQIEIDGATGGTTRLFEIGERYFETLDAAPIAGRELAPSEHTGDARVAIVNEPFVRRHLGGTSPLGRRVRLAAADSRRQPWLEIVGVVRDLGVNPGDPRLADALYVPMAPTSVARIGVRTSGDPHGVTPAILDLAQRESAAAQVQWSVTLAEQIDEVATVFRRIGVALVVVGVVALLLSAASLYAIVSFTVTRRTREIGLRVALGASVMAVLRTVLVREARQLTIGAALGLGGAVAVLQALRQIPFDLQPAGIWLTGLFTALMLFAGIAACAVPARRALSIQPMDALRHD